MDAVDSLPIDVNVTDVFPSVLASVSRALGSQHWPAGLQRDSVIQ